MTIKQVPETELKNAPPFITVPELCRIFGIPEMTFRVILWRARKRGIPMPPRRRFARRFLYDLNAFSHWAWEYADQLAGDFVLSKTDAE